MEREEMFAKFILENHCTIRFTARNFNTSKSTVHNDVSNKLKKTNYSLYLKVKKILDQNFNEKHIRGGQATKNKYIKIEKQLKKQVN